MGGTEIAVSKPRVRVPAGSQRAPAAGYLRGEPGFTEPKILGWMQPTLREPSTEIREAWRHAAARMVDLIQNSGFIAGIVDQSTAATVGSGLRINLVPDYETLGWTEDEANAWAKRAEARFALWANNPYECDAEQRRSLGQMASSNHKHWLAFGETLALFPWERRPGAMFGTKVALTPAFRLSQQTDDQKRIVQGIRLGALGQPVAYLIGAPRPGGIDDIREVRGRDQWGRMIVAHVCDAPTGAVRGITPLAPILRVTKQFDQLADATLTSAIVRAVFAATIESDLPTRDVLEALQSETDRAAGQTSPLDSWLDGSAGWNANVDINLGQGGRIAHLYSNEHLKFHDSSAPTADYEKFASFLLREIARCAGLTFEAATGDYRNATYSSIRMGTADIFPLTVQRRKFIHAPFHQAAFEAWLEEDIAKGGTPFPGGLDGFYELRPAAARADWRGGPKPQADDEKTAKAHEIWKRLGTITDQQICDDLGTDVEDVYRQLAYEKRLREEYGLPDYVQPGVTGVGKDAEQGPGKSSD